MSYVRGMKCPTCSGSPLAEFPKYAVLFSASQRLILAELLIRPRTPEELFNRRFPDRIMNEKGRQQVDEVIGRMNEQLRLHDSFIQWDERGGFYSWRDV